MGRDTFDLAYDPNEDDEDVVGLDEADDEEWAYMSCSMDRRGQCGQAGTEFCDFECPVMRGVREQDRKRRKPSSPT
jgi:hypothetical protein